MQAHYEFTRLAFRPGGVPAALPAIERALASGDAGSRLLAVLVSEVGVLNEILIVQALDGAAGLVASRDARQRGADCFGVADTAIESSAATFASFPFVPPMTPGRFGPVFELREYTIRPAGLPRALAAWEAALPARLALSPLLTVAYALDGVQPRMVHLWPYASPDERARIRAEAIAKGGWPPKGGPDYLVRMRSSIYLPAPFSPLQ